MNEGYTRAPHRRSEPYGTSPNAALLIDFDNVTMAIRSNLGQELRNFLNSEVVRGKVSVQRAYADWRRYQQYIVPLSEASIDLIFAPAYGSSKKNATDIRLAIDALELVFTRPEIGTFILLSGDSDFSSLVLKLKEYGKYVIGVGLQESSSDLLVQNCDEYYSYNSLSGLTSAEEIRTQSHDPWELVRKAAERMVERDDVMRSDRLKQVMLEFDPSFDEKNHGFSKFNRFLAEASSRGLLRIRKIGDGQYEVAPLAGGPSAGGEPAGEGDDATPSRDRSRRSRGQEGPGRRDRSGREGRGETGASTPSGPGGPGGDGGPTMPAPVETESLRAAYRLLGEVVTDLTSEGEAVRDSEVKREMLRRNGSFDETALGFSKFSRFLRQAYDEEVIELETDDDGNYHLRPAGAGSGAVEPAEAATPAGGAGSAGGAVPADAARRRPAGDTGGPPASTPTGTAESPRRAPGESAGAASGRGRETADATARSESSPEDATARRESSPEDATARREPSPEDATARSEPSPEDATARREPSPDHRQQPPRTRRSRSGLGRFRPGTRGAGAGAAEAKVPGPSDGEEGAASPSFRSSSAKEGDDTGPGGTPEASPSDREDGEARAASGTPALRRAAGARKQGGLGRFRRGRKGGGTQAGVEPDPGGEIIGRADSGGKAKAVDVGRSPGDAGGGSGSGSGEGSASAGEVGAAAGAEHRDAAPAGSRAGLSGEARRDPVEHMTRSYPGVGRRTADKLVEAFGQRVFEVIDRQPDRLAEVLPEHRARAVVEAREAEREKIGS